MLAPSQVLDRGGLGGPVDEQPGRLAGVKAIRHCRELRPDRAVECQHYGEHPGELLRGGGDDVHAAPGVLVLVGNGQHLGIDPRQDAREHVGAETLEVADADALQRRRHAIAQRMSVVVAARPSGESAGSPSRRRAAADDAAGPPGRRHARTGRPTSLP